MKSVLTALIWVLTALVCTGQTIISFPAGKLATEDFVKKYVDSVMTPKVVVLPDDKVEILKPCLVGPELGSISQVKGSSLVFKFHGEGVFGLDWKIYSGTTLARMGSVRPSSSTVYIEFSELPAGKYTLKLFGNTCQGRSEKDFFVLNSTKPKIDVRTGQVFDHFMNTTGYGFAPTERYGMNKEWVDRIESMKYDWGWGITGIRLCVRWHDWEEKEGVYAREGLQKVIKYCRDRNLKLAVFFWPWRKEADGFIPDADIMRGHRGSEFEIERDKRMGSLSSVIVNQKMYRAVRELSKELATYEKGYNMSIGTAAAEEYINPIYRAGLTNPEIIGFEPGFQDAFGAYLTKKGRAYQRPELIEWDRGVALNMNNELGKDFARFISISLTNYFDNFTKAVKEGSKGKILSCYMYPDAASPAVAWHLHGNFASQAASADQMYGTDGDWPWDIDRKLLCNAVNLGMGKQSIVEFDPQDLGQTGGYGSPINLALMEEQYKLNYASGVQVIQMAMSFTPEQIGSMSGLLKRVTEQYIGKPYTRPDWPTTNVPIADNFFKGYEVYKPYWTGKNFLKPDDTGFWGEGGKP
jgi:hypothetical protein